MDVGQYVDTRSATGRWFAGGKIIAIADDSFTILLSNGMERIYPAERVRPQETINYKFNVGTVVDVMDKNGRWTLSGTIVGTLGEFRYKVKLNNSGIFHYPEERLRQSIIRPACLLAISGKKIAEWHTSDVSDFKDKVCYHLGKHDWKLIFDHEIYTYNTLDLLFQRMPSTVTNLTAIYS